MSRYHAMFGLTPLRIAGRVPLRDGRVLVERVQCPACRGQGEVRGPQSNMPWFECRYCGGSGVVTEQQALIGRTQARRRSHE